MRAVDALESGRCKMDVVDPVLSNGCATPAQTGITWHPIKPATNAAFALGMLRWMFDNDAYNADFLALPNYQAALDAGYASYTDASHLVIVDEESPNKGKLMRPEDTGIQAPADENPDKPAEHFVVVDAQTGEPALHDGCTHAVVDYEGQVNGIQVRSALLFLKDEFMSHTVEEWARICGFDSDALADIAREFTSHGVKSSAAGMGATSAVNGLDAGCAYDVLNGMVGSNQMVGGTMPRRIGAKATADGARYLLSTVEGVPDVSPKNATRISRSGIAWEATEEYRRRTEADETNPIPELPWYPLIGASDSQALISITAQYPYQAKVVIS